MKSKVRLLIISAIVLILLVGAFVALKLTEPKDNSSDDSSLSSITTKLLFDKDPEKISSVKIENQSGSYTVTKSGTGYSIDGYEGLPLDDTYLSAILESTASVTARAMAESAMAAF